MGLTFSSIGLSYLAPVSRKSLSLRRPTDLRFHDVRPFLKWAFAIPELEMLAAISVTSTHGTRTPNVVRWNSWGLVKRTKSPKTNDGREDNIRRKHKDGGGRESGLKLLFRLRIMTLASRKYLKLGSCPLIAVAAASNCSSAPLLTTSDMCRARLGRFIPIRSNFFHPRCC